jgi:hypothetical protein
LRDIEVTLRRHVKAKTPLADPDTWMK